MDSNEVITLIPEVCNSSCIASYSYKFLTFFKICFFPLLPHPTKYEVPEVVNVWFIICPSQDIEAYYTCKKLHDIIAIIHFRDQIFIWISQFKFMNMKMVGSLFRIGINSDYLVHNNSIEPKVICANFGEYENKLKKSLVELSCAQLIIKLL